MPDGSVKYVRVVGHPSTKDESGDESGNFEFVGAVTDITEGKRAEESLRRSEGYLAEAQRLTHTGSWVWRVAGREALHLSEEWYRVYGFDPETGVPTWEERLQRIHPEDRAIWQTTIDRAIGEKSDYELEFRILLPGGTVRYIHTVGHPVVSASGDLVQFVGSSVDVTERKRAEALRDGESCILEMIARDAALEEILENLVRVVEAQFAGLLCSVLLLDEDGKRARHGAAPSLPEAYSKAIDGLCIGPKAGSCGTAMYRREPVVVTDILQDPLWEAYRDVAEPYGFRACWSTPILAHSGQALGSFAMYYREPRGPSPAETRALEMATHLAGIAIERKLAREERERLRQAQADLAHINRVTTMGELTASLAHEIRQPISAASTNAKTCLRWLGRDDPDVPEAREAASRIVKDITRAADIIGRISLLFKKGGLQPELVDVNELIREMIVLLRSEASRYAISIRTEFAENLPKVMADRVQLQQVLMNLMLNGIDAMKEMSGGSELTIKSRVDDGQLLISVSDTGVGLPPEEADQIFSAFFTTKDNGTGMGLPISRSIIESHGGRLWAAGAPGRGATFQFTLPATVAAHA
jgi:PAS domain S-box-containing protein